MFKRDAARLVRDSGKSVATVARERGVGDAALPQESHDRIGNLLLVPDADVAAARIADEAG